MATGEVSEDEGAAAADRPALHDGERLVHFSDAGIAIAVTLLVLPLADAVSAERVTSLHALVDESGGEIFAFLLSFVVICRFWLVHHAMFRPLRSFDQRLFWLNVVWLLSIVLLPYATELVGQSGGDRAVVTSVYVGTMLLTSCATVGIQWFVGRTPELRKPAAREPRLAPSLVTAAVFAFVLVLAMIVPRQALLGLLLLVPAGLAVDRISR